MTLNIYIDQVTKDISVNSVGNIVNNNSLLTEIYARLSCPLGSYRYDTGFGSTLPSIIQNRQKITLNSLKNSIVAALLPIVNRGSIINIDFQVITLGIGSFSISLTVTDSDSTTFSFPYSVKG